MNIHIRTCIVLASVFLCGCPGHEPPPPLDTAVIHAGPIVADHRAVELHRIPSAYIDIAKRDFGISYGHTSHGSQIISGMSELMRENNEYAFGASTDREILTLFDHEPSGDLGSPDRREWERRTRAMLDRGWGDVNIVMWAWCGQVSSASEADISLYLSLMEGLEKDYPSVVFIYMTGHLDGTGRNGNLHRRNNQIRTFCRANNKVLFDFADIERFDPDGKDLLDHGADDRCDYLENGEKKNWAVQWCTNHPGECDRYRCAHSEPLNCDRKAAAFWWLLARIAGWDPEMK